MKYVLRGFDQEGNLRQYGFIGIAADRTHAAFTVSVDVDLIRRYDVPLQELPILCHQLLDKDRGDAQTRALMFSEEDIVGYVNRRAEARCAAQQKKTHHPFGTPDRPVPTSKKERVEMQ